MGLRGPLAKDVGTLRGLLKHVPQPPSWLGEAGRAEWKRAAAELGPEGRNCLTEAAVGLLEDLARAADDAAVFRSDWKEAGRTVKGQGREMSHPAIRDERESRNTMNRLRRELGLTPASVSRVPAGPEPEEASGFEDVE